MKDTKFIELLNLYVDQQIDPADAALLEQEIARNSTRRDTYREYCQMHRACGMIFEQSLPQTSVGEKLSAAAAAADRKIVAFPGESSRSHGGLYAAGLGLAAACVAVAFVLTQRPATKQELVPLDRGPIGRGVTSAQPPAPSQPLMPSSALPANPPVIVQKEQPRPSTLLIEQNQERSFQSEVPESLKWLTSLDLAPLGPVNTTPLNFDMKPIQAAPTGLREQATEQNAIKFRLDR